MAILEVETFSLNFDKSESKLQRALETSIFIQNASVIPFRKALGIQISKNKCFWTSEVNPGRQRPLKIKKMVLITFECKSVSFLKKALDLGIHLRPRTSI